MAKGKKKKSETEKPEGSKRRVVRRRELDKAEVTEEEEMDYSEDEDFRWVEGTPPKPKPEVKRLQDEHRVQGPSHEEQKECRGLSRRRGRKVPVPKDEPKDLEDDNIIQQGSERPRRTLKPVQRYQATLTLPEFINRMKNKIPLAGTVPKRLRQDFRQRMSVDEWQSTLSATNARKRCSVDDDMEPHSKLPKAGPSSSCTWEDDSWEDTTSEADNDDDLDYTPDLEDIEMEDVSARKEVEDTMDPQPKDPTKTSKFMDESGIRTSSHTTFTTAQGMKRSTYVICNDEFIKIEKEPATLISAISEAFLLEETAIATMIKDFMNVNWNWIISELFQMGLRSSKLITVPKGNLGSFSECDTMNPILSIISAALLFQSNIILYQKLPKMNVKPSVDTFQFNDGKQRNTKYFLLEGSESDGNWYLLLPGNNTIDSAGEVIQDADMVEDCFNDFPDQEEDLDLSESESIQDNESDEDVDGVSEGVMESAVDEDGIYMHIPKGESLPHNPYQDLIRPKDWRILGEEEVVTISRLPGATDRRRLMRGIPRKIINGKVAFFDCYLYPRGDYVTLGEVRNISSKLKGVKVVDIRGGLVLWEKPTMKGPWNRKTIKAFLSRKNRSGNYENCRNEHFAKLSSGWPEKLADLSDPENIQYFEPLLNHWFTVGTRILLNDMELKVVGFTGSRIAWLLALKTKQTLAGHLECQFRIMNLQNKKTRTTKMVSVSVSDGKQTWIDKAFGKEYHVSVGTIIHVPGVPFGLRAVGRSSTLRNVLYESLGSDPSHKGLKKPIASWAAYYRDRFPVERIPLPDSDDLDFMLSKTRKRFVEGPGVGDDKGIVYVLKVNPDMPNLYKIGCTDNLKRRIRDLRNNNGMPEPLLEEVCHFDTPRKLFLERLVHTQFDRNREPMEEMIDGGTEVFAVTKEEVYLFLDNSVKILKNLRSQGFI